MHDLIEFIVGIVEQLWYTGIFLMMTLESSFVPFPSEVAMVPAGYLVAEGRMSLMLAFLAGTLWAMTWATINYLLGMHLWKPVVQKLIHNYGKYIFLNEHHYKKSEKYFENHGVITTLIWRFIPAVRQLISIPAGIFRMNYLTFCILTFIWAGTWNAILIAIGYIAGENSELIKSLKLEVMLGLFVVLGLVVFAYVQYVKSQAKKLRKIEETIEHNHVIFRGVIKYFL